MKVSTKDVEQKIIDLCNTYDKKYTLPTVIISSYEVAYIMKVSHRTVRKALSNLRKRMFIMMPVGRDGMYVKYDENKEWLQERMESYVRSNIRHIRTMYFNDVVKFMPIIKDQTLLNKIGQVQMLLDEGEQE